MRSVRSHYFDKLKLAAASLYYNGADICYTSEAGLVHYGFHNDANKGSDKLVPRNSAGAVCEDVLIEGTRVAIQIQCYVQRSTICSFSTQHWPLVHALCLQFQGFLASQSLALCRCTPCLLAIVRAAIAGSAMCLMTTVMQ